MRALVMNILVCIAEVASVCILRRRRAHIRISGIYISSINWLKTEA